jgi:hypothetical protein
LVGVAVNVTSVPEHTVVPGVALIDTDGVTLPAIVIMTVLLAVGVVAQLKLLVSSTLILSLLFRVELVYVALVAPAIFTVFSFHW